MFLLKIIIFPSCLQSQGTRFPRFPMCLGFKSEARIFQFEQEPRSSKLSGFCFGFLVPPLPSHYRSRPWAYGWINFLDPEDRPLRALSLRIEHHNYPRRARSCDRLCARSTLIPFHHDILDCIESNQK